MDGQARRRLGGLQAVPVYLAATAILAAAVLFALPRLSGAQSSSPASVGSFGQPFVEPFIGTARGYPRVRTSAQCIDRQNGQGTTMPSSPTGPQQTHGFIDCKPAAGAQILLPSGRVLYWDALSGTENVELSITGEYGVVGLNEQSRRLDVSKAVSKPDSAWVEPSPVDGGAKNQATVQPILPGQLFATNNTNNAGSLFCAGQVLLADGRVLASGGTKYTNDPGNNQSKYGSTELEGIPNTRIYNPKTNSWKQTGSMHAGRWYGTLVTLGSGKILESSGLRRLVKPANTDQPPDPSTLNYAPGFGIEDGQNERTTETYNPATGRWTQNPATARRSLPLFPRLGLLPDGHVFYTAAGQAFNPEGQAYDEALWNIASSYDPKTQRWTDLGVPGLGTLPIPGFIGSTFSTMLTMVPDAHGRYRTTSFLRAGGVPNPPSPGGYFSIKQSEILTVDSSNPAHEVMTTRQTGSLATSGPFGRWYSSGTLLPDGEVLATSGSDRDEVALPGEEIPVRTAELFDPRTDTWRQVADQHRPRTYHNTANLLPDGRVLVGGHAIISNAYLRDLTLVPGTTSPNGVGEARDPTFEIYSPPYMYCAGSAAHVKSVTRLSGNRLRLRLDVPASGIKNVVVMRHGAITHLVDADQRSVEVPVVARSGNTITVQGPTGGQAPNVLPGGPYMMFINRQVGSCLKPSHAVELFADAHGRLRPAAVKRAARHRTHRRRRVAPRFTG